MADDTAYIIFDIETIGDGDLIARTIYAGEDLSPEDALARAHADALRDSDGRSDFVASSLVIPVAIGVARVGRDLGLRSLTALDRPAFRTETMVEQFWKGVEKYPGACLVDFNGRCFDMPVLELAAFRYAIPIPWYYRPVYRNRYNGDRHLDLLDWLTNFGASRLKGGLDLLAKLIGKPGKLGIRGEDVESLWRAGRRAEIADYCLTDVLDTYFVFLRTRVLTGEITPAAERRLVEACRRDLEARAKDEPFLRVYLDAWTDDVPCPSG
ncbi:MAG: ribonuclease H-like domain-containing protein [Planctomycetes bacterium]|nr:ribonuclease H-like domain-containing protein [Planctomycetota bacterium]